MYIPCKSRHQKHTIRNFILGELRRYVRCCTQEFNFLKIKNKFFKRLRIRGYIYIFSENTIQEGKAFFEKYPFKIYPQLNIEGKFYSETKETNIVENAEQVFHETFSNKFFNLMDNILNSNSNTSSIENQHIVVFDKVCYMKVQI